MAGHPEPEWKKLQLSFERPYKDDSGNVIPTLLDLTPEGERIYEPKEVSSMKLGENLRRIFQERGTDFFDKNKDELQESRVMEEAKIPSEDKVETDGEPSDNSKESVMTVEELFAMRMEIIPQLFVASGEMSHARDLLEAILSETTPTSSNLLSATQVTKPPAIISVQAFDAQLAIGNKDEALRKASSLFKTAAQSMERGRVQGEKYWVAGLQIRRGNWGLTPAPLPFGAPTGKGADKTSKDFIISYGLEGSPPHIRRHAVAQLSSSGEASSTVAFPAHQHTRLQISISIANTPPQIFVTSESWHHDAAEKLLDDVLKDAQTEVVDQEIFSTLVNDAGNLPTAHATVSERLIVIEVARDVGLTFELVDSTTVKSGDNGSTSPVCESIYHVLRILLLRRHSQMNTEATRDLKNNTRVRTSILQPIIDLLQYREFCKNVDLQLRRAVKALNDIGVPSTLEFTAVGEPGSVLVALLSESGKKNVGGEAIIRVDTWSTLAFTFISPCTLIAQLSHATIPISTVPGLTQLLVDEIERCILQRICELGRLIVGGIWFIDFDHCVARWEGCVLNFRISYDGESRISCSAFRLSASSPNKGTSNVFVHGSKPLLSWVKDIIDESKEQLGP